MERNVKLYEVENIKSEVTNMKKIVKNIKIYLTNMKLYEVDNMKSEVTNMKKIVKNMKIYVYTVHHKCFKNYVIYLKNYVFHILWRRFTNSFFKY